MLCGCWAENDEGENERLQMVVEMKAFKPLGVCRMARCLRDVFLVACYMLIWKVTPNPCNDSHLPQAHFYSLMFVFSFFLFKTLLRR